MNVCLVEQEMLKLPLSLSTAAFIYTALCTLHDFWAVELDYYALLKPHWRSKPEGDVQIDNPGSGLVAEWLRREDQVAVVGHNVFLSGTPAT